MSFPFLPLLFFLFWPVVADLSYNDERTKFSFGTFKDKYYGQPNFLQIPINQQGRERLAVPKAFYHFSENEVGADSTWGVPDDSRLLATRMMLKNNRREINGMYLPIPHMDPINVHLISQRTFEKGLDTNAREDSPEGALAHAKRLCLLGDEGLCEKALLHYHRLKSASLRQNAAPLHRQLMSLGDVAADTKIRDRVGNGLGIVVGIPGYEPVYMGAAFDNNNDGDYKVRFSPPR